MANSTNITNNETQIKQAISYHLSGNFYPSLPQGYVDPAYKALINVFDEEYDALVELPLNINPAPAKSFEEDGKLFIGSGTLYKVLRLDGHKFGDFIEVLLLNEAS